VGFVRTGIWEVTSNLVPPKARRKGYSGSKSELEQLIAVTFGSSESMREWISSFCDSRCAASSLRPIVAFRVGSEQMTLRFNLRLGHEVAVEVNDVMSDFGIVHITGAVVAIFPVWWSDVATKVRDRSDATPDSAWGTFRYRNQGAEAYGGYGWSAISG
jgi:hypothetical protein